MGFHLFDELLCFHLKKKSINLALELEEDHLKPVLNFLTI